LVFLGTTPIGASLAGWWGERFGVPSSIWGAGLICLAAAVVALVWQLRTTGDRLRVRFSPRPRLEVISREPVVAVDALDPGAVVGVDALDPGAVVGVHAREPGAVVAVDAREPGAVVAEPLEGRAPSKV
jgi:hypothetical protein